MVFRPQMLVRVKDHRSPYYGYIDRVQDCQEAEGHQVCRLFGFSWFDSDQLQLWSN